MPNHYFVGDHEYFPGIENIPYEGRESDNPLAFKFYQRDRLVGGKTMQQHLRFAVCYWHTFCAKGSDAFGTDSQTFPWDTPKNPMMAARARMDAAFEFFTKLGVPYYVFMIGTWRQKEHPSLSQSEIWQRCQHSLESARMRLELSLIHI